MAADTLALSAAAAADVCHHCGEALPVAPVTLPLNDQLQSFCCSGCAAAAAWIRDALLGDYYRLRSAHASRVAAEAQDFSIWDRDEVLAEHAHDTERGREITVLTDGMRCAACAWLIDRALMREAGVLEVSANAITGRIRLTWNSQQTPLSGVLTRLAALGYKPYLAAGVEREREQRRQRNRDLLRIGLAGLASVQAMMLAEALYLDFDHSMAAATRDFFRWITFLLATPVVFWAGWPFIAGAARELRQRQLGMDTLIAGSTILAWAASTWETLRGGQHVWFDAAVMFVFLLLAARMLEQRARAVASAQVDALARARPAFATRERADGSIETVPLAALAVGDVLRVAIAEMVPADGVLLSACELEEALLTGESTPVAKSSGDPVYAGTLCRQQAARLRVTGVGSHTRLSHISRLVEQAQAQRPRLLQLTNRVAHGFVLGLLIAALLVYIGWRIHDPTRAFEVSLALLIISCPCALALAVPAALAAAHAALARIGVLALRDDALERLARISDVVFDKTGTLTDAKPQLRHIESIDGRDPTELLAIACALERDSTHPLAFAFRNQTAARAHIADRVQTLPGQGIEGCIDGQHWRLGRAEFAAGGVDDGRLWLGDGHNAVARFDIDEQARPDAAMALAALRDAGLDIHLVSGDAVNRVESFATQLGIDDWRARQSPEQKLAVVRSLQADARIVAMVGDGINDAPVLAAADVSLALGEGAALAQQAADLVLTGSSLARIPQAIAIARRTRRVVRQNLIWALGYNVLALPLAAAGWVTPWLAALGMALSSLAVTSNALRLLRNGKLAA